MDKKINNAVEELSKINELFYDKGLQSELVYEENRKHLSLVKIRLLAADKVYDAMEEKGKLKG